MYCEDVFPKFQVAAKFSGGGHFLSVVLIDPKDGTTLESNLISVSELCLEYKADAPICFPQLRRYLGRYLKEKKGVCSNE